ncbi:hypothetical protein BD770DRAFT_408165 [Pilaira anomala]|nr:hypothetical protein BD770DRAFT_408165 [Pilaira anomala]
MEFIFEDDIQEIRCCKTCLYSLKRNKRPTIALINGLGFPQLPVHITELNKIEERLISSDKGISKILEKVLAEGVKDGAPTKDLLATKYYYICEISAPEAAYNLLQLRMTECPAGDLPERVVRHFLLFLVYFYQIWAINLRKHYCVTRGYAS